LARHERISQTLSSNRKERLRKQEEDAAAKARAERDGNAIFDSKDNLQHTIIGGIILFIAGTMKRNGLDTIYGEDELDSDDFKIIDLALYIRWMIKEKFIRSEIDQFLIKGNVSNY
jgi:hypothetical protein